MTPFVAYHSRWRLALLFLGASVFVVGGLWMAGVFGAPPRSHRYSDVEVRVVGWLSAVFFGLGALLFVRKRFDTDAQLHIGSLGICWRPWSDEMIPWSEIASLTVWSHKRQKFIVLRLRDRGRFPGRGLAGWLTRPNRMLTGGDIAISLTGTDRSFDEAMAAVGRFRR